MNKIAVINTLVVEFLDHPDLHDIPGKQYFPGRLGILSQLRGKPTPDGM